MTFVDTATMAHKHDWVAGLAEEGVFDGLPQDANWQADSDRMLAKFY